MVKVDIFKVSQHKWKMAELGQVVTAPYILIHKKCILCKGFETVFCKWNKAVPKHVLNHVSLTAFLSYVVYVGKTDP